MWSVSMDNAQIAFAPPPLSNTQRGALFSDPIFSFLMDAMALQLKSAQTIQASILTTPKTMPIWTDHVSKKLP